MVDDGLAEIVVYLTTTDIYLNGDLEKTAAAV
jgi:hypothetical protein